MAYVFGSNPDALAGQKNYYDATNIQLAERDRALRQQALDTYQQRQLEAQRQAEQQAYQFQQLQASQAAQAQARADQQSALATDAYRFQLGRQDTKAANEESKRRFDTQMDLQKSQLDTGKAQNDYAQAYNDIQAGNIEAADDIKKLYPNLNSLDQARATAALTAKQKGDVASYNQIASAAQAATGFIRTQTMPKPVTTGSLWWKKTETPPAAQLDEESALNMLAQNKNFAKALPHLSWDEASQSFTPNIPKPSILSSATPPAGPVTPPAAAAPGIPAITPISPPTVGTTPQTQPQPVAARSPSPASPPISMGPVGPVRLAVAPPNAHVMYLVQHPETAAQFDAKYGPGSAQKALTAYAQRTTSAANRTMSSDQYMPNAWARSPFIFASNPAMAGGG